jgi:hypothetical protein
LITVESNNIIVIIAQVNELQPDLSPPDPINQNTNFWSDVFSHSSNVEVIHTQKKKKHYFSFSYVLPLLLLQFYVVILQ